jgi:hypothetical protein
MNLVDPANATALFPGPSPVRGPGRAWRITAYLFLVPPLLYWLALVVYFLFRIHAPTRVLFESAPPLVRLAAMLASPIAAVALATHAVRRTRQGGQESIAAQGTAIVGVMLAVLALLTAFDD